MAGETGYLCSCGGQLLYALIYLFGMTQLFEEMNEFGKYTSLFLLGLGAVAFVIYDIFLGLFKPFYEKILVPKIQKRMK